MDTEFLKADSKEGTAIAVGRAAQVLRDGGLVVFPTETVYGLAARADLPSAMERLRSVKGRAVGKAFTVHIASRDQLSRFVPSPPGLAMRFAKKGWPGPLTLVLPVEDPGASPIMAELDASAAVAMYHEKSIGLRCPDHEVATELLHGCDFPVVAASANAAGAPPPRSGIEARESLGGSIELLIDAGDTRYANSSTILRVSNAGYEILREGVYDAGMVERLSIVRLLFVCTGNTCRSPMASTLASGMLAKRIGCKVGDLESRGVIVESAGISGGGGGASAHAVSAMSGRGLDLSNHVSRAVSRDMVENSDYIFAMTRAHREAILAIAPGVKDRVSILLGDKDVSDPIGGSQEEYEACAQMIETGIETQLQGVVV